MTRLASFIFYKIMRWKMIGDFSSDTIKKCVVIAVPHTSWHDFYLGLLIRKVNRVKISFMGKKELFKWPFGWYFRKVGGIALDRTPGQNKVEAIAKEFEKRDELRLTLAPEGTRKKVSTWKTGFYYIAIAAEVPIIMVAFDFGKKRVVISDPFYPTNNLDKDLQFMYAFFKDVKGKVPEYSFEPEV
ncbi:1-acyl-sn-glycerol-3-phosphate acyltransferase [Aquimarina sp. MMG015]|uniref:1-acyl-sn-glycerol-3-phosphate acyltransferase n=1 Tax=Aquimarina TaxID=290174 RepID=UPI000554A52B|nr:MULTISPECIES: 1-acyl-sn-glycerol-3-phosphate acyltransferase [Aquimarina]AXT55556.1 acyltransferase [Aquimarina sp. AD1]MBQ4802537.1 1-acyl-sn-glycerol-3-phosphate acyltransferase [Aquimarina sp. MMG015]RKN20379.1 acyltransferase [Aquimarina sp. AD1]